jgi:hypothetical protein
MSAGSALLREHLAQDRRGICAQKPSVDSSTVSPGSMRTTRGPMVDLRRHDAAQAAEDLVAVGVARPLSA